VATPRRPQDSSSGHSSRGGFGTKPGSHMAAGDTAEKLGRHYGGGHTVKVHRLLPFSSSSNDSSAATRTMATAAL